MYNATLEGKKEVSNVRHPSDSQVKPPLEAQPDCHFFKTIE